MQYKTGKVAVNGKTNDYYTFEYEVFESVEEARKELSEEHILKAINYYQAIVHRQRALNEVRWGNMK